LLNDIPAVYHRKNIEGPYSRHFASLGKLTENKPSMAIVVQFATESDAFWLKLAMEQGLGADNLS